MVDHTVCDERFDCPVDVDAGQTCGIADLLLGHQKGEALRGQGSGNLHANSKLPQNVCDPGTRIAATDVQQPLAANRSINQPFDPQGTSDSGPLQGNLMQIAPA